MESAPIYLNTMSPSITANPMIQRSIVAFPKRGKCNPYWCSLFPLLCFILCAFLLDLCALIFTCIIPSSRGFYNLDYVYLQIRAAALVLYAGAVVLTAIIFIFYFCNLFNLCDSIFTPYLLNLGTLFAIALTLPISVVMVVAEYALPIEAFDDAVYPNGFFTAGILGLAATLPLVMALCFSRFYEFCIGNYKTQKRRIENAADFASKTDISAIFQPPKSRTHTFYNV